MKNFYSLKPLVLLRIFLVLLTLDLVAIAAQYYIRTYTHSPATFHYRMFVFDGENNVPAVFSTINLLISAFLLFSISNQVKNSAEPLYHRKWYVMGCMFVWLALDELFALHENLIKPVRMVLKYFLQQDSLGFLYFAWVVPYVLGVALVGLYLFKFVFSLPKRTLLNFILSGTIFIAGAIGMEMVGGHFAETKGDEFSLVYELCTTFEEMLEMLGIIFFIHSLIKHIEEEKNLNKVVVNIMVGSESKKSIPAFLHQEEMIYS